jgi:hypothetical protein
MGRADNLAFWHVPGAAARRRPNAFAGVKTENHQWD